MGNSMPPPASFDLVDSVARLRGADVEILLAEPKSEIAGSSVEVSLGRGTRTVRADGELVEDDGGRRLIVRARRAELDDGIWTLTLEHGAAERQQLAARLLVQGDRPLVLLWGAKATHSLPPPATAGQAARRKAAVAGERVLEQALSLLPPERTARLRVAARDAASRLLR
ncbi:hypothetical protein [uncultured Jatrophihabitans sp.]|uniref:hypothetical protein n=1 Tax=uncultured Jatrophihabitans sp. TaxID=1610747 RepID=UPI0035CB53B3